MLWLLVIVAALIAFTVLVLRGENLAYLDQPPPPPQPEQRSAALERALAELQSFDLSAAGSGRGRVRAIRDFMDDLGARRDYRCEFRPLRSGPLRGEWVLAPGCDPARRLLYIHGGAFIAGSPLSHRPITDRLARLTGAALFAVDYRLLPEHRRRDGIEDCRQAWRWLQDNGPGGSGEATAMAVAGDSAGGNLSLSLIAWLRDQGQRQADAAVAFSPATDAVLDAPSLRGNLATDPMIGPAFGQLLRVPGPLLLWYTWFSARMLPTDPRISPLRGPLHDLPPLLIQASSTEMLLDDARRYAAKAQAAESPVTLQLWPNMLHVWQMFGDLPETDEAFERVGEFLLSSGFGRASAGEA